ncbi:Probable transcriptional regulator SLK3 [Striga hermonthica]|uniref:Probable transcriptional regulator SLK3 n=1 Tax=Striga hermonthica TaxID=68872 RepID=A0A9N7NY48_STRHE|nr:Probable transcriptional regulator SLK3 [Striga hermonthica]
MQKASTGYSQSVLPFYSSCLSGYLDHHLSLSPFLLCEVLSDYSPLSSCCQAFCLLRGCLLISRISTSDYLDHTDSWSNGTIILKLRNIFPRRRSIPVLNSVESSGLNNQASSLVTDANSGLSGGPHIQRSSSINTESYTRLPASPISFSSNNIAISGSCTMDGSSVVQPNSSHDQPSQQSRGRGRGRGRGHMGGSSVASLPGTRQVQFASHQKVLDSFTRDVNTIPRLQKRQRLETKQEDILQQQVLQQVLQRQDSMHLQNSNPQLQALMQEQRLRQQEQQQQFLQAMTPSQRVQFLQQNQQQLQLSQQHQIQGVLPACGGPRLSESGVCSRRLMQYLYHERQRPSDNSIGYWRKFVAEYYSPRAKKRWCLSRYNNVGHRSAGVIPQGAADAWLCDLCGSKSGRGFEVTFEVLPRLHEVKFGSGVIDELLFLDLPRELRFASGLMMLDYAKVVEESVYEQVRVIREGQLRIIFTPDLKILSWEFCASRHEELLPRRLVAPQVNQLLQVAQTCHSTLSEGGAEGISQSDLKSSSVMVVAAGRQLARSLELQSLNDLGFSKRYVRCLQIADVANSMKDLMDFCREYKQGPREGLENFTGRATVPDVEAYQTGLKGPPTDANCLRAFSQMSSINQLVNSRGASSGSPLASTALTNCQNSLTRQNSMNSTNSPILKEPLPSNQAQSSSMPGPSRFSPGILPNGMVLQQYLQGMGERYEGQTLYSQNQGGQWAGQGGWLSRSSSFKAASSGNEFPDPVGLSQTAPDLTQSRYGTDEIGYFTGSGFFDNDFDGNMKFSQRI